MFPTLVAKWMLLGRAHSSHGIRLNFWKQQEVSLPVIEINDFYSLGGLSMGMWSVVRENTFLLGGGGGGGGLQKERSLVKFLQTVLSRPGRVTLFSARKKLLYVASIQVDFFICLQTCKVLGKLKLVCTSKATSPDQSKLFTGVANIC